MPMPAKQIAGNRYGQLVALAVIGKRPGTTANLWACHCDCGQFMTAIATQLEQGARTSCGCRKASKRKPRPDLVERNKQNATHGMTKSPEWSSWKAMRARCETPTDKDYSNYGGRGIGICDRWQDFDAFFADMGARPPGMSIDRINVNGDYEPGNCRWATAKTQANNTRVNRNITHNGETKNVTQFAEQFGIGSKTLLYRVKAGWPIEKALTTEPLIKRKLHGDQAHNHP